MNKEPTQYEFWFELENEWIPCECSPDDVHRMAFAYKHQERSAK